MKKIKIIYYTDSKVVGGAEKFLYLTLKNINKDKFETFLICPGKITHQPWREKIAKYGVKVFPFATRNIFSFNQTFKIFRTIKKIKPDIIHFQFWSPYSCAIGLLAAWWNKVPIIISTEHSFVPLSQTSWYIRPFKALYQVWRKRLIDYPTTVSFASRKMMREGQLFKNKKILVVHNGIEPIEEIERPNKSQKIPIPIFKNHLNIVMVARLEEGKGHEVLIKAIKLISPKVRANLKFHFIGDGSLKKKLIDISIQEGLEKNVFFWGERQDVRFLLPNFDLFVFPSLSENFPFAILEAMAAGIPIIASNVGGIKEALKDNKGGFLVKPNNYGQVAEKIIFLADRPVLREKMGNFNQQFSDKNFNDKIMTAKIEKIYQNAINNSRDRISSGNHQGDKD